MTDKHLIIRALLHAKRKLAEALALGPQGASAAALWRSVAHALETIKLDAAADSLTYASFLAPVLCAAFAPSAASLAPVEYALERMQPASLRRLGLWAEAVIGMPNVADPRLPTDVLYLYCLRVVGLGMLGARANDICRELQRGAEYTEGEARLAREPSLADYIKYGVELHQYNRRKLADLVVLANCLEADVNPNWDAPEDPPLGPPLDQKHSGPADEGDQALGADTARLARQLGSRARIGPQKGQSKADIRRAELAENYTCDELRRACANNNLPRGGTKDVLIARLSENLGEDIYDPDVLQAE